STKPFSVASAPSENVVKITTVIRKEASEFKQALLELKQGMTVRMSGPLGSFYLKDHYPALLIAGGIGITPFRAMVKQLEAEGKGTGKQIHLLYLDSRKSYIFQDELDEIADHISMNITYLDSRDELYRKVDQFSGLNQDNGKYYIAGPKPMA